MEIFAVLKMSLFILEKKTTQTVWPTKGIVSNLHRYNTTPVLF